jgi:hypothetical protein
VGSKTPTSGSSKASGPTPKAEKAQRRATESRTRQPPPDPDFSKRCPLRLGVDLEYLESLKEDSPVDHLAGWDILRLSQSAWCRICPPSVQTDVREGRFSWRACAEDYLGRSYRTDQEEASPSEEEAQPVEEGRSQTAPSSPEESAPQADH